MVAGSGGTTSATAVASAFVADVNGITTDGLSALFAESGAGITSITSGDNRPVSYTHLTLPTTPYV